MTPQESESTQQPEKNAKGAFLHWLVIGLFLGWPIVGVVLVNSLPGIWFYVMLLYAGLLFAVNYYAARVTCAHCGKVYLRKSAEFWSRSPSKCPHCGEGLPVR